MPLRNKWLFRSRWVIQTLDTAKYPLSLLCAWVLQPRGCSTCSIPFSVGPFLSCTSCKTSGSELLRLIQLQVCAAKHERIRRTAVQKAQLWLRSPRSWQPQPIHGINCTLELRLLNFSLVNPRFVNSWSKSGPLAITNELREAWNSSYLIWDSQWMSWKIYCPAIFC